MKYTVGSKHRVDVALRWKQKLNTFTFIDRVAMTAALVSEVTWVIVSMDVTLTTIVWVATMTVPILPCACMLDQGSTGAW